MKPIIVTLTLIFSSVSAVADVTVSSAPWNGMAQKVPGRVEAEHYDDGPAGVAYHDVEEENQGVPYRKDTQVDIEKRDDASNGHGIGWTRKGEWLMYTVNVAKDGIYKVKMPVASNKQGGVFHFEIGSRDVSGQIRVPDTGGWDKLKTIEHKGMRLRKGVQTIKVIMDEQGPSGSIGDIDYFEFRLIK